MKVSSLSVSQVERTCGLKAGWNYNLSKPQNTKVPACPPEKEKAIRAAPEHSWMVGESDRK